MQVEWHHIIYQSDRFSKSPPIGYNALVIGPGASVHPRFSPDWRPFVTQPVSPVIILVAAPRPPATQETLSYAPLKGLYQGIEAQGPQVQVEHLRPASPEALRARLGDATAPRVDILILDGALVRKEGSDVVLLEGAHDGQPLRAEALGALLAEAQVGLALLHLYTAQEAAPRPWADALAAAFGGPVLCLQPGLPASSTRPLMAELLAQLLAGERLDDAVESARAALAQAAHATEATAGAALQLVGPGTLHWAPQETSGSGVSQVASFPQRDLGSAIERLAPSDAPGSLPPEPPTGLLGRDREIFALEALLAPELAAPAWVFGYDGIGKSALVSHTARWLVRTGRFERVVYSSLARSGMAAVLLYDLGRVLLGREFRVDENAEDAIVEALQQTPTLILWDDFHAVLPGGEFAGRLHGVSEWYRLAAKLAAAGPSRLCILSDGPALPESARRLPDVQHLEIGMLPEPAAADLLAHWCRRLGAAVPDPATLQRLVGALGGHPLTLRLLAALLADGSPETAARQLFTDLPGLATGEARFRNEALEILFERLVQALPAGLRGALPTMGLFAGGFPRNVGLGIMGLGEAAWEEQSPALARAGLMEEQPIADLTIPYVRMHPALKRLARQRLSQRARQDLAASFGQHYLAFLSWLMRSQERAPESVAALAYQDLGNLSLALDLILEAEDLVTAVNYGRLYTQMLEALGLVGEAQRVTEGVQQATRQAIPQEGSLGRPGVQLLWSQAERLMDAGELAPASTLLRQLVERMNTQGGLNYIGVEADLDRARTLCRLGRVLRLAHRYDAASAPLRRALELLDELEPEPAVRRERAELHAELAETLIAIGQYPEAEQECQAGLRATANLAEPGLKGGLHARLGVIAMRRNQAEEARTHYARALEQLRLAEDEPGMAAIETQLASLAMRPPADLARAQQHLERALSHAHQSGNALLEGQILVQLAQVVLRADKTDEAEALFRRAVGFYREREITPGLVAAQASLAEFLLRQGRLKEAQAEAQSALEVANGVGPDTAPWELFLLLQRIASQLGQEQEVARWRTATQEAFARSPQAGPLRMRWQPVINAVVQSLRGETMDAEAAQTIEEMQTRDEWRALGQAIMRILAGERDDSLWQELDHMDTVIVRAILDQLAQEPDKETPGE